MRKWKQPLIRLQLISGNAPTSLRRQWQQCLCLGLVVCALFWSYIECFILNFIPRVASCFYITELSTWGRNDVVIWIFVLDIYCHSSTVDRSSDAHDIFTWSAVTVTSQRGAAEHWPASKDHRARPTSARLSGWWAHALITTGRAQCDVIDPMHSYARGNPSHHRPPSIVYKQWSAVQPALWWAVSSRIHRLSVLLEDDTSTRPPPSANWSFAKASGTALSIRGTEHRSIRASFVRHTVAWCRRTCAVRYIPTTAVRTC